MPGNHRRSRGSDQLRHIAGYGIPSFSIGGAQAYGGNTGQGAGSAYSGASNQQTSSSMAGPSGGGSGSGSGSGGGRPPGGQGYDSQGNYWSGGSILTYAKPAVNYSAAPPSQSTALSNTRAHEVGYGSGGGAPGPGGSFDRAGAYGGGGGSFAHQGHQPNIMHSYRFNYDYPVVQPYEMLRPLEKAPPNFDAANDPYGGQNTFTFPNEDPRGLQQLQNYTGRQRDSRLTPSMIGVPRGRQGTPLRDVGPMYPGRPSPTRGPGIRY